MSREEAIETLKANYPDACYGPLRDAVDAAISALEQPELKKGEWEEIEVIADVYDISGVKTWASKMRCDQCGFTTIAVEGHFSQYNFCPHCGAELGEAMS